MEGNCKEFGSEWKCLLDKVEIFKRQIREDEEEAAAEEKKLCNLASAPHIYSLMGWLSDFVSHCELNAKSAEEAMSIIFEGTVLVPKRWAICKHTYTLPLRPLLMRMLNKHSMNSWPEKIGGLRTFSFTSDVQMYMKL